MDARLLIGLRGDSRVHRLGNITTDEKYPIDQVVQGENAEWMHLRVEPLAQFFYSEESKSLIPWLSFGGIVLMWVLRSKFRKPKWTLSGK